MPAGHQYTPRRSADGVAGIVLSQPHAFRGQVIQMRGSDLLLSEGTEFPISQVVGQNQHDVGRCRRRVRGIMSTGSSDAQSAECRGSENEIESHGDSSHISVAHVVSGLLYFAGMRFREPSRQIATEGGSRGFRRLPDFQDLTAGQQFKQVPPDERAEHETRLKLYQEGKPYRDFSPTPLTSDPSSPATVPGKE